MKFSSMGHQFDSVSIGGMQDGKTNDQIKIILDKKLINIQAAFDKRVKDVKALSLDNACEFVLTQSKVVSSILSNQHRKILEQFIAYKDRTNRVL